MSLTIFVTKEIAVAACRRVVISIRKDRYWNIPICMSTSIILDF